MHAALSAVMLERHEQQTMFDAAFDAFFRDPKLLEQMMYLLLPKIQGRGEKQLPPRANRLAEALAPPAPPRQPNPANETAKEEIQFETEFSFSERERLRAGRLREHDHGRVRAGEEARRTRAAAGAAGAAPPPRGRRARHAGPAPHAAGHGAPAAHAGAGLHARRAPSCRRIVVLLDISGSMDRYSRLFLHYVHGLTRRHLKVHTFTFGTRLTNITRCLRHRDPDVALKMADAQVHDWKGGTRIASSLDEFNRRWARRVLGANAAVLLVTDGLERDDGGLLAGAAAQLHRMAHEVVWLNPLLRFDGFEPRAAGVRTLLPHVDRFLPVHNLASLADLAARLAAAGAASLFTASLNSHGTQRRTSHSRARSTRPGPRSTTPRSSRPASPAASRWSAPATTPSRRWSPCGSARSAPSSRAT